MKQIKVGILGLALSSQGYKGGNLGCYALGLSFFEVLNRIAVKNGITINVVYICTFSKSILLKKYLKRMLGMRKDVFMDYYTSLFSNLIFSRAYYLKKSNNFWVSKEFKQCKCVFDFTAGDSFSDIYGEQRFWERTALKELVIKNDIPLILGSQTIGPFKNNKVLDKASSVIKGAKEVFVRDDQSKNYVEEITGRIPKLTTDIAFFLPFNSKKHRNKSVGFNPSGLLWSGGYDGTNQFGLTVEYQKYCKSVIESLLNEKFEVHLIMHAYYTDNFKYPDNDFIAAKALHEIFPQTILAPEFSSPIEAKSYISQLDVFIGARMHATIGALSAGIPVIPFSYSRKFEGLFSSLKYPYVLEGTKWTTKQAIDKTLTWIHSINDLKSAVSQSSLIINEKNSELLSFYEEIIIN